MCMYIELGKLTIPTYGLMIALGVVTANMIALAVLKRYDLNIFDFIILEAYTAAGGFLGAKLLFLWVSRDIIDWSRMLEGDYFKAVMQGGFVFYGGLIGGVAGVLLGGKIHGIRIGVFIEKIIFLIPWIHCFGRIGCFLAGCCYGRPYDGILSVVYPEGSLAPSGIPMFPIQLVEAALVLLISILILVMEIKRDTPYTMEIYFISYAIVRFVLEYYRSDEVRGHLLALSTSQWISVFLIIGTIIELVIKKKKRRSELVFL